MTIQQRIMPHLHVAVIIPSTLEPKHLAHLTTCVKSIQEQSKVAKITTYIVSDKKPTQVIKKRFSTVIFVSAPSGFGFGELNNEAIQLLLHQPAKIDWVLLLNDDAWLRKDFIKRLASLSQQKQEKVDVYAPCIFEASNPQQIESFGVEYFRSGYAKNCRSEDIHTTLATAGCIAIRFSLIQKLTQQYGYFFNPLYFYYLEDVDLSLRICMMGGVIKKDRNLNVYHHGSLSSGGRKNRFALYHTYRNLLWVIICCWPVTVIFRNMFNILLVQVWLCLYGSVTNGMLTYPKIIGETTHMFPQLLRYRRKTLAGYSKTVRFSDLLAKYSFRTFHNRTVPAV